MNVRRNIALLRIQAVRFCIAAEKGDVNYV